MITTTLALALAPASPTEVTAYDPVTLSISDATRDSAEILALDSDDNPDAVIHMLEHDGATIIDIDFADGAWVSIVSTPGGQPMIELGGATRQELGERVEGLGGMDWAPQGTPVGDKWACAMHAAVLAYSCISSAEFPPLIGVCIVSAVPTVCKCAPYIPWLQDYVDCESK